MTPRTALAVIAVLLAVAGCRRSAVPPSAAATDYRTLTKPQLEMLIQEKTGSPATLTAAGANKYTGTQPSPDGTVQVPVTVTVEEGRIVIESRVGGLSSRKVITPRGLVEDDLRESPGR